MAPPRSDRLRALAMPALVAAPFVAATAYVANVDPNAAGHYPTCPFLALTGFYCPGCGGLRAVHALTHGHPLQALHDNVFGIAVVGAVAVWWVAWLVARVRGRPLSLRPVRVAMVVALVVMPVFTVLRNLPIGHFLAP
ncbi:MAG: DUF2752 domain-containing protein [Streptosporangiales bacterium]|nr:DUF2752 domain-containing protein [Streptosporangiales bacterium]MBO0891056.1 DUF2752 domain-containing protein [Acidothermales bacterium]